MHEAVPIISDHICLRKLETFLFHLAEISTSDNNGMKIIPPLLFLHNGAITKLFLTNLTKTLESAVCAVRQ